MLQACGIIASMIEKIVNAVFDLSEIIFAGFIGAVIALLLEKLKRPKLEIIISEKANQDYTYPKTNVVPGRWKFYRVYVRNKQMPRYLSWLLKRETAEQVHAKITIREINKTMKGRWAGTMELPTASPLDIRRLVNFPEPETIFPGEKELLDVFAKHENDSVAYGWNNESYLNKWRTPKYKMTPGSYEIEILLEGTNSYARRKVTVTVGKTIEKTKFMER